MRSVSYFSIFLVVFLGSLIQIQAKEDPGKIKSVYDVFKDVFLHNFDKEKLTNDFIHILKVFGGKEGMETYYKIPKSERDCIMDAKADIIKGLFRGQFTSPDQAFIRIKEKCPKASAELSKLYDKYIPYVKDQMQKVYQMIQSATEQTLPEAFTKGIKEEVTSFMDKFDFSEFMGKDKDEL